VATAGDERRCIPRQAGHRCAPLGRHAGLVPQRGCHLPGLAALGCPTPPADVPRGVPPGHERAGRPAGRHRRERSRELAPELPRPDAVHLLVTVHADDPTTRDGIADEVAEPAPAGRSRAVRSTTARTSTWLVHFGSPRQHRPANVAASTDPDPGSTSSRRPLGTLLLGHPTAFEDMRWQVPSRRARHQRQLNASASRAEGEAFEEFSANRPPPCWPTRSRDAPAAGPWRLGGGRAPPATPRMRESWRPRSWAVGATAPAGAVPSNPSTRRSGRPPQRLRLRRGRRRLRCPVGSHIRRCNRATPDRAAQHQPRPPHRAPGHPYAGVRPGPPDDGIERGLLGVHLRQPGRAVRVDPVRLDEPRLQDRASPAPTTPGRSNEQDFSSFSLPVGSGNHRAARLPPLRADAWRRVLLPPHAERAGGTSARSGPAR